MKTFQGKTVLVTGGSSGIGLETAKQMLREGATVVVCGRSAQKLEKAKESLPGVHIVRCDVTSPDERVNLREYISANFGTLDVLVNNAGIAYRYLMEKTGDLAGRLKEEWETNYLAPVLLSQELLPLLARSHGTVINVCSGLAYIPLSFEPNYCATKAALHSMSQSMRLRYAKVGVKVVAIYYPEVDTPFNEGHPTTRAITPQLAVSEAIKQLKKGKGEIRVKMAGMIFLLSRIMPRKGVRKLNGFNDNDVEHIVKDR